MKKKILIVFLILVNVFLVNSVYAITDAECQADVDKGNRCGEHLRDCAEVNGKCVVSSHAKELNNLSALSCYDYHTKEICDSDNAAEKEFSCVWVTEGNTPGYCNVDKLQYVKCGGAFDIPEQAPRIMSFAINLLKIGTPIVLILTGIVTLVKALAASKEDEIKKAQSSLIRKAIAAVFVFLVIMIVQFVILKVADSSDTEGITSCLSCFLNNDCDKNIYFKTKVGDEYQCHLVSDPSKSTDCGEDQAKQTSTEDKN